MHTDLMLLASLITDATPSAGNIWMPICLPHLGGDHFVHAFVALLSPQMCLLVVCTEQDSFFAALTYKQGMQARLVGTRRPLYHLCARVRMAGKVGVAPVVHRLHPTVTGNLSLNGKCRGSLRGFPLAIQVHIVAFMRPCLLGPPPLNWPS